jgi:hypothetical protein
MSETTYNTTSAFIHAGARVRVCPFSVAPASVAVCFDSHIFLYLDQAVAEDLSAKLTEFLSVPTTTDPSSPSPLPAQPGDPEGGADAGPACPQADGGA